MRGITIWFDVYKFVPAVTRNAGRMKKLLQTKNKVPVVNADIVYYRYGKRMTWNQIADELNISRATLFRRKKVIMESLEFTMYMRKIDMSKVDDYKYLRSVEGGSSYFY